MATLGSRIEGPLEERNWASLINGQLDDDFNLSSDVSISSSPAPTDIHVDERAMRGEGNLKARELSEYKDQPGVMQGDIAMNRNSSPSSNARDSKRSGTHDPLYQSLDFSDIGNAPALDVEATDVESTCKSRAPTERNTRQRLNESPFALRAVVPKICKDVHKQAVEDDILMSDTSCRDERALNCVGDAMPSLIHSPMALPYHKILQLDVSKIEEQTFHLKIHCKKTPGVLVELTRALEALDCEISNAILTCVSGHVHNTAVVKWKEEQVLEVEELKNMLLEVASKFGLCQG